MKILKRTLFNISLKNKYRPELRQIIWNILAEEKTFETKKATLLINNPKWSLEELKLISRVLSLNYSISQRKFHGIEQEEEQKVYYLRDYRCSTEESGSMLPNRLAI